MPPDVQPGIYGDIGESWWNETVSAGNFVRELNELDVDAISVRINSIGGSVPDGLAIFNAMRRHKATITTEVDGMAFSIASLIAMGGDKVHMASNAMLMIHAPWTYAAGNSAEFRELADQLDSWAAAMSTSYAMKTGDQPAMLALLTDGNSAADNARRQKEAAAEIAAAFERAGIQTKESLKVAASTALADFEKIKASGQATSEGLQAAWKRAADAAIAANDGVAPAWVQAQASAQKYQLAIDEAGRATLKLANTDLSGVANGLNDAAQAAGNYAKAVAQAGAATPGIIDPSQKIKSTQVSGETRSAGTDLGSRTGVAAFLKAAGVSDEAAARRIANEFADSQGNIPYFNNPGQKKYGGDGSTLSQALLKAAEQYTFDGIGRRPDQGATIPKPESTRTVRVNLEVNGQGYGSINTDAAGADALDNLLSALESARSVTRH